MTGRLIDLVLDALRDKPIEQQRAELHRLVVDAKDLLKPIWPECLDTQQDDSRAPTRLA